MPGYSVLFNKNCEPQFEFGKHHRNFVTWFEFFIKIFIKQKELIKSICYY